MVDVDTVRKYVSVLMGKKFQLLDPRGYLIPKERIRWFLYSGDAIANSQTPYVHAVWIGTNDSVYIDTDSLGNTPDTTEWMYGDQALHEFVKMDLTGFEKVEVRSEYAKRFPRVIGRLNTYARLVSKKAAKLNVDMRLLYHGSKGIASFWLEARFGTEEMTAPLIFHAIDKNVAALKQTYYEIAERQRTLYFMWALEPSDKGRA